MTNADIHDCTRKQTPRVVVAGHICLDIIPVLPSSDNKNFYVVPGSLVNIGPATLSPGGAVANVGIAMHRLGVPVTLEALIGDDVFGRALLDLLRAEDPDLITSMIVKSDQRTSYSIVIDPPRTDRSFLHFSGANDTLGADDFDPGSWRDAALFHFGYPPIMPTMFANDGAHLTRLFQRAKSAGLVTSLDMCAVDPASPAGAVNWRQILKSTLPYVDLFVPSFDELLYMLESKSQPDGPLDMALVSRLAQTVLDWGAGGIALKLGEHGLYMRTGEANIGRDWARRELWQPCFEVEVVGTTGAGDCTVAGLLAAWLENKPPERAIQIAAAAGASSVESADATKGVQPLYQLKTRLSGGWATTTDDPPSPSWHRYPDHGPWIGPHDKNC